LADEPLLKNAAGADRWEKNGDSDLVYIKTANTPNGHVEVHIAAGWDAPAIAVARQAQATAAVQAIILANEVNGIRVHNTGAFIMSFSVGCSNGSTSSPTNYFEVGGNMTISVHNGGLNVPDGSEIWPIAHIQDGVSNHGAGHNVVFRRASNMTAVYNCSGTTGPELQLSGELKRWSIG